MHIRDEILLIYENLPETFKLEDVDMKLKEINVTLNINQLTFELRKMNNLDLIHKMSDRKWSKTYSNVYDWLKQYLKFKLQEVVNK